MLILLRAVLYSIAIPAVVIALVIALATSNKNLPLPQWELTHTDITRAKRILHANKHATGKIVSLNLSERDLNIAGAYLLNAYTDSQSQILLSTDNISFQLRFSLPENLFGRFLDIQFQIHAPVNQSPEIKYLQIGKIAIPDIYAGLLLESTIKYTQLNQYLQLISHNLKTFQLYPQHLHIEYHHPTGADKNIQQLLTPSIDNSALDQYQATLDKALLEHDADWRLSLSNILQPLFQLAVQRSAQNSAIEENRLAIFVANRYVNYYPGSNAHRKNKNIPKYAVFLYKRIDMAQHFMWSATFAAQGNSHLANLLGLEKELSDAKRGGSGFSFIDLAADRAGLNFGKQATASPVQALKLQQRMASIKSYQAFMPEVRDLPEGLTSAAFKRQYKTIYSPQYQRVLEDIDQRISSCEIYR